VWIVCHGYGQLAARFARAFQPFIDDTRLIVAPEALSRFYVDVSPPHGPDSRVAALWMTREDRDAEIADIVTYLDTLAERVMGMLAQHGVTRDAVRLHALGFSQGAPVVCRWAARGAMRVDHLVLWGGGVPDDVNARAVCERIPGFSIDLVYGTSDWWLTSDSASTQTARLRADGVPHRVQTFEGGHVLNTAMLRRVLVSDSTPE
jgi:predicted esterase